ncbi:MAG: hypothetical protein HY682_04045 [Chloroflexi bacterium]|nr:hypothetical protein [Chloroflexota bacterium]
MRDQAEARACGWWMLAAIDFGTMKTMKTDEATEATIAAPASPRSKASMASPGQGEPTLLTERY